MAQQPKSGATGGGGKSKLLCAEWEILLLDYLDGTLNEPTRIKDAAAFEAHRETCPPCAQLLEESKRGAEWLHFLQTEPEVPSDLVARILAQTSGANETLPAPIAIAGMPIAVAHPGWLPGLERRAVQSRWMMTAAMAFFSIAFTLNLTGVKLTGFRLSDLKPANLASGLTRQFYVADAHFMRYYDNLRFVYELESRVREIRRDVAPSGNNGQSNPPADKMTQPQQKKPNDGSAQKDLPGETAPPVSEVMGEPVLASEHLPSSNLVPDCEATRIEQEHCGNSTKDASLESSPAGGSGTKRDRAERSLA